ncbi:hypothetical protein L1987_38372 [Smallanthus sonchifolius]|uniref:Uncharacterized protein n=1 Tax=Smallanthus sonchifolius TaxID=185202 RepID=A0ACB9HKD9_9ASTR|nr:hypothetical protein L1987_38372 [Smallanthus sonchifolius]
MVAAGGGSEKEIDRERPAIEMALSESSTNNIENYTIEIVEVGHSRSEFEINQGKEHNVMDQNAQKSSSGDIISSSDNAIDSPLKFIGVEQ